jgi:alkanesulfonate monooxygenase SsuD/methylene tetrahydromethanopterin reductase-like flavin-dependent oxidoreductase (luciferase family)
MVGLFTESSLNRPRDLADYYRELCAQIVLGDELGFDFFATTQSYGRDFADSTFSVSPDPMALFASQIPNTRRIKLLTAIVIAAFHHPGIALSDFATVDLLSGGRVILGIGRGHPWLLGRMGIDQGQSRERLSEFCRMTAQILRAPEARHTINGKFWQLEDFELIPGFVQPPDVYVAVTTSIESALEAAENGFGIIIPSYVGLPMEMVEQSIAAYQGAYRKKWGRPGRHLVGVHLFAGPDDAAARANGARALAEQFRVFARNMVVYAERTGPQYPAYLEIGKTFVELSDRERCIRLVESEWPRLLAIWGDERRCIERIGEVIERTRPAGIILNIDSGGLEFELIASAMRYTAERVMPAMRAMLDGGRPQ